MKILIVEDSATLRLSMKRLVADIGHTPIFANSGEEALQMIGSTDFDLVIMDVEMPGLDGFETTTLMREALDGRWVPIIFATGHTSDKSVLAGIEAGGDDYLIKPISRGLLEAKLKAMHRIAQMQQQLTLLNSELAALSQRDGLTQLLNRNTFMERASQSLKEARRHATPGSLLMLDVDFFKKYNDRYGHVSGDDCLRQVAAAIQASVKREVDIVGRYGGEEFIVMLPETDLRGAALVANNMIQAVEGLRVPHRYSTVSNFVTISIGISVGEPSNGLSLETLVLDADKNLYAAKDQGRNRVVVKQQSHRTILIANGDDEQLNRLTDIMQPLGNIITADTQLECIELAKEIRPDLILLDGDEAGFDGRETEAILKRLSRTVMAPVLYATFRHDADMLSDTINIADNDPESLRDLVMTVLE